MIKVFRAVHSRYQQWSSIFKAFITWHFLRSFYLFVFVAPVIGNLILILAFAALGFIVSNLIFPNPSIQLPNP